MYLTFFLFSVAFDISLVFSSAVPNEFQICQTSNSDGDKCLANAIESALHGIGSKGISSLGLPSIDPIDIKEAHIGEGSSVVNLVQNYYDVKLYGFSKTKVLNAHFDKEKNELSFTTFNDVKQKATYNITGKILLLPVYGNGDSVLDFKDATIVHKLALKDKAKTNISYKVVDTYEIVVEVQGAKFSFDNLFNGDKTLGDSVLKTVNENSFEVFKDVKGGVEKTYALVFKALANRVFEKIPADEIFK